MFISSPKIISQKCKGWQNGKQNVVYFGYSSLIICSVEQQNAVMKNLSSL